MDVVSDLVSDWVSVIGTEVDVCTVRCAAMLDCTEQFLGTSLSIASFTGL